MDQNWKMLFRILRLLLWQHTSGDVASDLLREGASTIIIDLDKMLAGEVRKPGTRLCPKCNELLHIERDEHGPEWVHVKTHRIECSAQVVKPIQGMQAVLMLHDHLAIQLNEVYRTNIGDLVRPLELKDGRVYFEVLSVSGVTTGAYWKSQESFVSELIYTG